MQDVRDEALRFAFGHPRISTNTTITVTASAVNTVLAPRTMYRLVTDTNIWFGLRDDDTVTADVTASTGDKLLADGEIFFETGPDFKTLSVLRVTSDGVATVQKWHTARDALV